MEERRVFSIETVLLEIGKLQQTASDTQRRIDELWDKVGFQNGRVSSVEKVVAFLKGVLAVVSLILVPLVIRYIPDMLNGIIKANGGG